MAQKVQIWGRAVLVLSSTVALPLAAQAATVAQPMAVTATVKDTCTLSTAPVAFGTIDVSGGTAIEGTGSITVKCSRGSAWNATASAGAGGSVTSRKMTLAGDATESLNYQLYVDSGRANAWSDSLTGTVISGTGTATNDVRTVYASILAGQASAKVGSYSDSVTVTVTYP
jgi:spore coat protein U-like protein